jgi:transcriptional regulator with XRE-family HTH domain
MTTAERIRAKRDAAGWTQRQLAQMLDTDQGTVSRWENGDTPELRYLVRLAGAFNCTLDELVPREEIAS